MTERGDWVGYYDEQGEREPRDVLRRKHRRNRLDVFLRDGDLQSIDAHGQAVRAS